MGTPTPTPTPAGPGNAFVYTANPGGNSIAGFANDSTGALKPVPGSPISVAGNPIGIAATTNGKFLYASSFLNASIAAFSIDSATGALTPIACSPAAVASAQPLRIAINPVGTFLYTSNQSGSMSGFSINSTTGCLTLLATVAADSVPRDVTVERTGKFVYVVTAGEGIDVFAIGADGTPSRVLTGGFDSGTTTMTSVRASPTSDVLLATDAGNTNVMRSFAIDTTTGALSPVSLSGVGPASGFGSIAFTPAPGGVFVAATGSNNIVTVTLSPQGNFFGGSLLSDPTGPVDLAVDPSGKFLYAANNGSGNVAAFDLSSKGALVGVASAGSSPQSIVVVGHP